MNRSAAIFAGIASIAITAAATAQTRLPEMLQKAAEMRAGVGVEQRAKDWSPWHVEQYGSATGKGCTLYYTADSQLMMIAGPNEGGIITDDPNETVTMWMGPNIPLPKDGQFQYQKVTVRNEGQADRSVRAIIAPNLTGDGKGGTLILYSKQLEDILGQLKDAQSLGIDIDKKPVVTMRWTGATPALTKLRDCVAGKAV
jgi:hypothetical protein